jgi:O-antigen ligase
MLLAVTATATPEAPEVPEGRAPRKLGTSHPREVVAHTTMVAALLWWGLVLTYHSGGRDRWVLTLGIPLALAALVAARPWSVLSTRSLSVAAAVVTCVVAVCLVAPTHWYAGSQAATYAYAAALLVAVRAYARTPFRRTVILGVVLAVGLAQFGWAFAAWQRLGSASAPMMGRFFWYNQFAAFELAPAVIGLGLALRGAVPLRLLAGSAAVLGSAGVLLSTSRASMALLGLGWVAAASLSLLGAPTARARTRVLARLGLLTGLTAVTVYLITGPPFFDHRASPLSATVGRGAAQPVAQNGAYRLDFWHQSLEVFSRHVLSGAGFGSFGRQTRLLDAQAPHAQFAHNGYLQAFSDGGLLLGVPFALACIGILVAVVRRCSRRAAGQEYGAVALVAVSVLLLAAHSGVDFDWSYPSSMAEIAVLAGLALAWSPGGVGPTAVAVVGVRGRQVLCGIVAIGSLVLAAHAVPGGWLSNAPKDPSLPATVHGSSSH